MNPEQPQQSNQPPTPIQPQVVHAPLASPTTPINISKQKTLQAVKSSVLFAVSFGLLMGIYFAASLGVAAGITSGVICLVGSLILMPPILIFLMRGVKLPQEFAGDTLVYSGIANRMSGAVGAGGYLFLTSKSLVFVAHKVNIDTKAYIIPLDDIQSVDVSYVGPFIPSGLAVFQKDGTLNRFVVYGRKIWVRVIQQEITKA